ncbi:MAG TPA: arsenate reductase (glutaredoxin) [Cytophagales bacterium]|jgi:arsenate reductase|nr:arsenate reductase (glutaredoxin) [Cytophagales bacterium]
MKIYHNPRRRKSRDTLAIIENSGAQVEIVEYLKTPPAKAELKSVLDMLGMKPEEIVRKGEGIYKDNFKGRSYTDEEWLDILIEYPKLIERPIVVKNGEAVIGRPPENVKKLL